MLRYKTETRPGLVALYDIWPGNGAGQFLQPRSPHGAQLSVNRSHINIKFHTEILNGCEKTANNFRDYFFAAPRSMNISSNITSNDST